MATKKEYQRAIADLIDSVCPYADAPKQRLYHIGFMTAHLAELCENDPWRYRELRRKIDAIKKQNKR